MKLDVKAFTFAFGIIWGISLFLLTWWLIFFEGPTGDPTLIGRLYRGYTISYTGSFIGLIWGFFDGAGFGLVFSLLYNALIKKSES